VAICTLWLGILLRAAPTLQVSPLPVVELWGFATPGGEVTAAFGVGPFLSDCRDIFSGAAPTGSPRL
jgi:hypothetical protein